MTTMLERRILDVLRGVVVTTDDIAKMIADEETNYRPGRSIVRERLRSLESAGLIERQDLSGVVVWRLTGA